MKLIFFPRKITIATLRLISVYIANHSFPKYLHKSFHLTATCVLWVKGLNFIAPGAYHFIKLISERIRTRHPFGVSKTTHTQLSWAHVDSLVPIRCYLSPRPCGPAGFENPSQNSLHNVWCISVDNTCSLSRLAYIIHFFCLMSDERNSNRHANIRIRSYKVLEDAQLAASTSDAAYDSRQTRSAITQLFKAHSGKTPYDWQLESLKL